MVVVVFRSGPNIPTDDQMGCVRNRPQRPLLGAHAYLSRSQSCYLLGKAVGAQMECPRHLRTGPHQDAAAGLRVSTLACRDTTRAGAG